MIASCRIRGTHCWIPLSEQPDVRLSSHPARSGQKSFLLSEDRVNHRDSPLLVTTRRPIAFAGARIRGQYRVPLRFPLMSWTAFTRRPNTRKSAGFPHGMMSPCGSIPMSPITGDQFAFSAILYPHRYQRALRLAFPKTLRDLYGLTTFRITNMRAARDLPICRRGLSSAWSYSRKDPPTRLPFCPSL